MPGPDRSSTPLVIVKLGGSVITRKREIERLRGKVLARLAREIAAVPDHRLVLLHGAGGFGHPGAARFGLARAPSGASPAGRARGASIVSAEVRRLHLAVLRSLVAAGANPWSIPPANHAVQTEGRLRSLDPRPFSTALEHGWTPVSFGDVVPDPAWGSSILSADTIALALARALTPRRVLFVTDVPGVLVAGADGRATVVSDLTDGRVAPLSVGPGAVDVTGGIRRKVETALEIARSGVDAGIISGLRDGALSGAIRGDAFDGSWARARGA